MEAFNKLIATLEALEKKQFRQYLAGFLGAVALAAIMLISFIFNQKAALIARVKSLNTLTQKSYQIIEDNRSMVKEEMRMRDMLDKEKGFTIKSYFEQFCRDQNCSAEPGWETRTEDVNESFEEVYMVATFKDITSEKLVQLLEAFNKKDIVYLKDVAIKTAGPAKITAMLTIATTRFKTSID